MSVRYRKINELKMYSRFFKLLFDYTISIIVIVFIGPLILLLMIWLYFVNNGSGVFFTQQRVGKNNKIFRLFKFKSMTNETDCNGVLLPDADRLTKVGKFIRSTSLDELPQFINILRGEMSLIGPRPLLVEYLPLYNDRQIKRHEVKPGITGWAQVNGRNAISWEDKFEFDVWYIENISFSLDLKVVLLTIKKVFIREGISSEKSVTMDSFKGSR